MAWAIMGILIGIIVGANLTYTIPIEYIKYTAVLIIGVLDALFGAAKAEATNEKFNQTIFLTGLLFNIILAIGFTYLGEKLGLELYLAVVVVFIFRIFTNLGITRRSIVEKFINR